MSASGAGYDQSVTTYSPEGRVYQVEYADKAVQKGGTIVGVRCTDGVVMGLEKMVTSKLLTKGTNRSISSVAMHAGMAIAGLSADGRQLVNKARDESSDYHNFYGHAIPGRILAKRVAGHVHMHTLYWYLRPFGCAAMIASYDSEGPQLHLVNPSGVFHRYFAAAEGKHKQAAKSELEKLPLKTITCAQAVTEIAKIIYRLHDDIKDKEFELQMSWVCDASNRRHVRVPQNLVEAASKVALEEKRKAEMDDSESDSDED